jgi:ferrous iron transport protein A
MPLSLTEFNHFYIINKVCGLEKQRHYLESLGFIAGSEIELLSEIHGYYIVMVKGSKIGIEKSMAKRIILYAA